MFDNIINNLFGSHRNNNNNRNGFLKKFTYSNRSGYNLTYKLVSFEQAKEMIENESVVLIDVRSENEYNIMHLKNAINIPVTDIEKNIFIYEQTKPLMVYCSTGTRSKNAIMNLNRLGYNNIYIWEYAALATFPYKNMLIYNK
ncbi:MAG: rhodanese-like domain-containing protein [Clostridia bacterium]|nr:rhodanese-like domain-containing protein [Clostridia bacterium]